MTAFSHALLAADSFFRIGNYLEAALWVAVAATFALWAARRRSATRRRCVMAAAAFMLFGLSDVVEAHTGAWWRPWWLLVWKTLCVLTMIWLLRVCLRDRRKAT